MLATRTPAANWWKSRTPAAKASAEAPPAPTASPDVAAGVNIDLFKSVPLTGITLDASLKMRCDLTGAAYAVYWAMVGGTLTPVREYVVPERKKKLAKLGLTTSYKDASAEIVKKTDGTAASMVAGVYETGDPAFFGTAATDERIQNKETLVRYGISSVAYERYEGGVIEFGTGTGDTWETRPPAPIMPKPEMRRAFEELGALYVVFWAPDAGSASDDYVMQASYESPRGTALLARLRGDRDSFVKRSQKMRFKGDGTGPVATASRQQAEVVVIIGADGLPMSTVNGCSRSGKDVLKRADDMIEFGLSSIHFVPVEGGVFEYGVPKETSLSSVTLEATLELETEAAGAGYAIYWTRSSDDAGVVAGKYTTPEFKKELEEAGRVLSFPDASESFAVDLTSTTPVAEVLRTRKPLFIPDVESYDRGFLRRDVALSYNVKSIAFVPVLGGVIELGTSTGDSTSDWASLDDVLGVQIPNAALSRAFKDEGATYAIFWKRNLATGVYDLIANYESNDSLLNKAASLTSNSFTGECAKLHLPIMGDGPVAKAGKSGVDVIIPDVMKEPTFRRKKLAEEWGVGKMTLVPCASGVLEYGTVTKDKRQTTTGSEFQEAQRPYRRDVFGPAEWVNHRSTSRFKKSMRTIVNSGVFRARFKEIFTSMAIAAFVTLWNHVLKAKLLPKLPALSLGLNLFTLTAPALGLLLVFRTNTCYGRWDEARKTWGSIINKTRNLVRQANAFFKEDAYPGYGNFRDGRRRVAAETSAFTRCLRTFLRGPPDEPILRSELSALGFTPSEVEGYMSAANRQVYALSQVSTTLRTQKQMDPLERSRMDTTLSALLDDVGACERIFKTPIPRVYTAHTARFTGVWLFLLPFTLNAPSVVPIIACGVITFFMLGIEELGVQIEEPFSVLPLESFCDNSIGGALDAMVIAEDEARRREKDMGMRSPSPQFDREFSLGKYAET